MMKAIKFVLVLLTLLTMGMIFRFSSQTAGDSNELSKSVTMDIINVLPFTKNLPDEDKQAILKEWNNKIRKYAHFVMFAALGFICTVTAVFGFGGGNKGWIVALIICLLYAASDEIHQFWVPNRGPQLRDVMIDFSGSVTGSLFLMLIYTILHKKRKRAN